MQMVPEGGRCLGGGEHQLEAVASLLGGERAWLCRLCGHKQRKPPPFDLPKGALDALSKNTLPASDHQLASYLTYDQYGNPTKYPPRASGGTHDHGATMDLNVDQNGNYLESIIDRQFINPQCRDCGTATKALFAGLCFQCKHEQQQRQKEQKRQRQALEALNAGLVAGSQYAVEQGQLDRNAATQNQLDQDDLRKRYEAARIKLHELIERDEARYSQGGVEVDDVSDFKADVLREFLQDDAPRLPRPPARALSQDPAVSRTEGELVAEEVLNLERDWAQSTMPPCRCDEQRRYDVNGMRRPCSHLELVAVLKRQLSQAINRGMTAALDIHADLAEALTPVAETEPEVTELEQVEVVSWEPPMDEHEQARIEWQEQTAGWMPDEITNYQDEAPW